MSRPAVGDTLACLDVTSTLRQLVRYAGASGDFYEMHYDTEYAHELGHRGLAVHGLLKAALLGRFVRRWLRPGDTLASFEVSYRGLDYRDETMRLGGEVAEVRDDRARLDLWIDSADGSRSTFGHAEVELGS